MTQIGQGTEMIGNRHLAAKEALFIRYFVPELKEVLPQLNE
jgi:hypothetical protein